MKGIFILMLFQKKLKFELKNKQDFHYQEIFLLFHSKDNEKFKSLFINVEALSFSFNLFRTN